MTALSICMPSNRPLKTSRRAIESALSFVEQTDAVLILSDNSFDAEKRAAFENASPRLIYTVPEDDDAVRNWMNALSHVQTPFLLPMGDDDELELVGDGLSVDLMSLPGDVVGVRPTTSVWSSHGSVDRTECFTIDSLSADARLREYHEKAEGNNSIYYSIFRSETFLPLVGLFQDAHPTRGGYCDWPICLSLFTAGRVVHDPAIVYRYDLGHWATADGIAQSTDRLYRQAGLPSGAGAFADLLMFLDLHVFTIRRSLALPVENKRRVLLANCQIALASFVRTVKANPERYDETVRYLVTLLETETDIDTLFQISVLMADCVQPGLKDRYVRFFQRALSD